MSDVSEASIAGSSGSSIHVDLCVSASRHITHVVDSPNDMPSSTNGSPEESRADTSCVHASSASNCQSRTVVPPTLLCIIATSIHFCKLRRDRSQGAEQGKGWNRVGCAIHRLVQILQRRHQAMIRCQRRRRALSKRVNISRLSLLLLQRNT